MAEALVYDIVASIVKNLGSRALNEIASAWGFKSQLDKLKNTINTIKDVLQDAEERQLQSHAIRGWLGRLKVAVYDVDDLFDELATIAAQKEAMGGSNFTKEVKSFFSHYNHVVNAFSVSNKIKRIREELDVIVKDGRDFAFVVRPYEEQRAGYRKDHETHSFVDVHEVVGRDGDKKAILDILGQYHDQRVCVVPIVGIGGLGKTTLAQLVYDEVAKEFDLSLWVCVSDDFDIKEIILKILKSATNTTEAQNLELDQLQKQLRSQLIGKKYLLVLDDMWNDDVEKWRGLSCLLKAGREGSKILVTTRLIEVARITGTISDPYLLKGLSDEESLSLFMMAASGHVQEGIDQELVSIGKEIVKKCAHVPLAIRTLGGLLCGKGKSAWLSMKDKSISHIPENDDRIMGILKVSYDHLRSPLKNCFAYCALFPKDYSFNKQVLIHLWMAQGFVIPLFESQSLEDAGEEYFLMLLHRCFFQDVIRDEWRNVESFKMHDLMHDLALKVAGFDYKVVKFGETDFDNGIRHLSFGYRVTSLRKIPPTVLNLKLLRTFLLPEQIHDGSTLSKSICHRLSSYSGSLRTLDLHCVGVKSLPSSIGNLIHLRYLDLTRSNIEELPNSITKLQNLQTLRLRWCINLRRLPHCMKNLTNLRSLDVSDCWSLRYMPTGLGVLTSLHSLPLFMVNLKKFKTSNDKMKTSTASLSDLKNLNSLRNSLEIRINKELKDPNYEAKEANMSRKHGLVDLFIRWEPNLDQESCSRIQHDEAILESLQPHQNLKKLQIYWYRGENLPSWAVMDNFYVALPNLVEIGLLGWGRCHQVPSLSRLPHLKRLSLGAIGNVEYIERNIPTFPSVDKLFFPSLEVLDLSSMDKLKGWCKEVDKESGEDQPGSQIGLTKVRQLGKSFLNLLRLSIMDCPNMKSMPHCPKVDNLTLVNVNENLSVLKMVASSVVDVAGCSTLPVSSSKLKVLRISDMEALLSLPKECLSHITELDIRDPKLVDLFKLEQLFKNLSSLPCLRFTHCNNLRSIRGGLENLIALQKLVLFSCKELELSPSQDTEDFTLWRALNKLQHLELVGVDKLVTFPAGLQHVTSLCSLCMSENRNLEGLPDWISCLSSLEKIEVIKCPKFAYLPEGLRELTSLLELTIIDCPQITKRCQGPADSNPLGPIHLQLNILSSCFFFILDLQI